MTDPKRKLIFHWPYLEWGGAQVYMMAIMKEARAEWDITAVIPKSSSGQVIGFLKGIGVRIDFLDIRLIMDEAPTLNQKIKRQLSRIRAEAAMLKYLRPLDLSECILHTETAPWQSWIFLAILCLMNANVFVTMHNAVTGPRWRRLIWKARMQFLSRLTGFHIFASNQDTKQRIRPLVERKFWNRIPVTYTCVDPREIEAVSSTGRDRSPIRARHGLGRDKFIVLAVGQFIDRKGRWIFLEAARALRDRAADIEFVWMTPAEPSSDDLSRIESYELSNFRLILSSDVGTNRNAILEFFLVADIFALPSFVEGLPIALLEAMALGIPSIATNVYAIPEAVMHEKTGLLIGSGNGDALAEAILRLRRDQPLSRQVSKAGKAYVLREFDERAASRIAIAAYKECFADAG